MHLIRGDTYYVADGTYAAHEFDDAPSGTTAIIIKKATAADHGTDAGWDPAYGDGSAEFVASLNQSVWTFSQPYYVVDGQVGRADGSGGSWTAGEPYGFRLRVNLEHIQGNGLGVAGVYIRRRNPDAEGHHITLEHVEVQHAGEDIHEPLCQRSVAVMLFGEAALPAEDLTFRRCFFHDVTSGMVSTSNVNRVLFDQCYFARRGHWWEGESHCHGQAFSIHPNAHSLEIARSVFQDVEGTALITVGLVDGGQFSNVSIHGNVFFTTNPDRYRVTSIIATTNTITLDGLSIFNNTMARYSTVANYVFVVNLHDGVIANATMENNLFYNLAELNSGFLFGNVSHDYNMCYHVGGLCTAGFGANASMRDEVNGVIVTRDPVAAGASHDYHLVAASMAGHTLAAAFGEDMEGRVRGADGVWDRGAFEFDGHTPVDGGMGDGGTPASSSTGGSSGPILPSSTSSASTSQLASSSITEVSSTASPATSASAQQNSSASVQPSSAGGPSGSSGVPGTSSTTSSRGGSSQMDSPDDAEDGEPEGCACTVSGSNLDALVCILLLLAAISRPRRKGRKLQPGQQDPGASGCVQTNLRTPQGLPTPAHPPLPTA